MTPDNKRNEMIRRGRIILDPWDTLAHYMLAFGLGAMTILMIVLEWNQSPPNPTSATTVAFVFIVTVSYLIQRERLKLKKETIDLELNQMFEVIDSVGKSLDWLVETVTKDFIQGDTTGLGTNNRITIFIRGKDVYINCRTTHGDIPGMFKQEKMAETFLNALRMRSYEVKHQKSILKK